jgi:hypothetical protein
MVLLPMRDNRYINRSSQLLNLGDRILIISFLLFAYFADFVNA